MPFRKVSGIGSGFAHELAVAAGRIACQAIPMGEFYDHRSVNLYLPIPFSNSLRIEGEPEGETGDGPYWQIDCGHPFPNAVQS